MFFLVLSTLLTAEPASPKALFDEGKVLYAKGEYAQAAKRFEQAQKLKPHPSLWFNVGRCYEQLKDPAPALRAFRSYLYALPQASDRASVQSSVTKMTRLLLAKNVSQLALRAVPNAQVSVDGVEKGVTPLFIELGAGEHLISLTAEGFERLEKTVTVSLNELGESAFELVPNRSPEVRTPAVDVPRRVSVVEPVIPPPTLLAAPPPPAARSRVATWIFAGTAVAAAGAGVGLMLGAQGASNELLARQHPRAEADRLVSQTQSLSLASNIAYGAAGAAAVTAIILFFVEGSASGPSERPTGVAR